MSFSAVASYPSDKGSNFFGQEFEDLDNDFFEQFLDFSPAHSEGHEYSALPQPNYLERSMSDSHETLSSLEDDSKNTNGRDSWQGDSWATFDPASASSHRDHLQGNGLYSELSGRAAISDSELLSLEGITLDSPHIHAPPQHSLPSSPSPAVAAASRRKTRLVESLSKTFKKATSNIERSLRSPIRKNSSPNMGRVSNRSQTSIENLGNKLEVDALKFKFDFEENPVSFLSHTGVADKPTTLDEIIELDIERPDGVAYNTPQMNQVTAFQTPMTTPILSNNHSRKSSGEEVGFPTTPQHQNTTTFWRQAPGSSERNNFSSPSIYPAADIDAPVWWNHASTTPLAQPSPNGYHTNPQLATKSLALQLQNDLAYQNNDISCNPSIMASGLMIQMPGFTAQQSFVTSPPTKQRGFTHSAPQPHQRHHHARRPYTQASPRQPPHTSPATVRKNRSSGSSDSDSPKSPSPTTSTSFHVRKRKSPKTSKHSTPRTPPGLGGAVDFVNYTPSDSRKILTGVAPSGSSKTKARREKEAMDKRRKLSQAALRAVKAAGGDVESLVEQGLFA
ncbi:Developmental regulatory protein wetA [Lachnellula cervina]|uniref:Developmental regulatory protein wetA n=1 Tax=Lachnellula cervina TaxID=1316786 RepID=A0A7D8YTE9_9HELO|nr:Developmental regulatory protein wetA [Lachnellula cervina]